MTGFAAALGSALVSGLTLALHAALLLALAPVLAGGLRRVRARLLGRAGPPVMQGWLDLVRLARKQPVLADNASWLFAAVPGVCAAAVLAAALLVPSFALGMATAPLSDLLVVAGLLGAARFALALAALDTGTAFGGIGASRAGLVGVLAEPVLLLVFLVVALLSGTTNLDLAAETLGGSGQGRASLVLALLAACAAALAANGRLLADDPAAHPELTTIYEAAALEYSGRHLALVEYAAALRLLLWLTLIAAVFLPFGLAPAGAGPLAWVVGLLAWAVKVGGLAAIMVVLEASVAAMRVFRLPEVLGAALLLALLASVLLFVSGNAA